MDDFCKKERTFIAKGIAAYSAIVLNLTIVLYLRPMKLARRQVKIALYYCYVSTIQRPACSLFVNKHYRSESQRGDCDVARLHVKRRTNHARYLLLVYAFIQPLLSIRQRIIKNVKHDIKKKKKKEAIKRDREKKRFHSFSLHF